MDLETENILETVVVFDQSTDLNDYLLDLKLENRNGDR